MKKNLVIAVLVGFIFGAAVTVAQVPAGMFNSTALSSSCIQPPVGQSTLCIAGDKVLVYTNGGPPVQIGVVAAPAGVTSFNGRTGAVMPVASDYPFPPPPVTSVNGKTGAVVLSVQ